MLRHWESDDEVKDMMCQIANLNDDHVAPERLQRQNQSLIKVGERSVYHVFLPCSLVSVFYDNRLLAFMLAEKNSKTLIAVLHKL